MIAQVLNRQFVLDTLANVRDELQREAVRPPEMEPEEMRTAQEDLSAALEREKVVPSIQSSFDPPPPERRGEEWAELEDFSFFSRDPIISIGQSILEEYFETHPEEGLQEQSADDDQRRGPGDEVVVTGRSLPIQPRRNEDNRRLFGPFEVTDPGWISSAVAMGIRLFRRRFKPFPATPPEPRRISGNARLILAGDWGSGIPRAQRIGEEMRKFVEKGDRETHVVHLGDVYYSGFKKEYEKRFLPSWPVKSGEETRIGSWSLSGNHDMYSGGHAYFRYLLTEPRFRRQEGCSFFGLHNEKWDIFGLDSGYEDGGLEGPQAEWVLGRMNTSRRKVMLLSHHQFFSGFDDVDEKMVNKTKPIVATGRVRAWFWGHEHRCSVFQRDTEGVGYAACVGHSGVPVYMTGAKPKRKTVDYLYPEFIRKGVEKWALFGFVVLEFNGEKVHATYVDENGTPHREDDFE